MPSLTDLKKLQRYVFYKEHKTRKRDAVNKDRQWVIIQKFEGKRKLSTLGWQKSDGISAGDATNKADLYKANFRWNKLNPDQTARPICKADETRLAETKQEDYPSFEVFAERFLTNYAKPRLKTKTIIDYERHIKKVFIPVWGQMKLVDIQRKQIILLIEKLAKTAPIQANRKLSTLKKLLNYAVDVGAISVNPASGIKPPSKENVKDRVLTLQELATMFKVLKAQDNRDTSDILCLIALTGQRPGEVAEMRISQLKDEADGVWWTKAGADTKNKQSHRTFLSEQALAIIQARVSDYELDNYIFPATRKDGSVSHMRKDVTVSRTRKVMPLFEAEGIEKFTAHDLRRSAATGIAILGFGGVVPDILNHKPQGITRQVYDKYSRAPEIKRALISWGEAIDRAISGKTAAVIPINNFGSQ